jgi:hypothetical protein
MWELFPSKSDELLFDVFGCCLGPKVQNDVH